MREWEAFVPEEERKIYEKAGYKGKDNSASIRRFNHHRRHHRFHRDKTDAGHGCDR